MKTDYKALMQEADKLHRSQVILCTCGKVFAACLDPLCYHESDWMRDVRKYSKQGYKVEMRPNDGWEWCDTRRCKQTSNPLGL